MEIDLRALRTAIPALPAAHVGRPRLVGALDRTTAPLTVLAAGPGWGKTVLLSEWGRVCAGTVAWLSLERTDDHPDAFWGMVLTSLHPDQDGSPTAYADLADEVSRRLVDLASDSASAPVTVIIDDAHLLTDRTVLTQISALVRASLPGVRFVMAARSDPLLPLHRLRMDGLLAELRAADLGMDSDEIAALLAVHEVGLSDAARSQLAERTQGWTAGLRLSALRMQGRADPSAFVSSFAVERGSIGEYLTEEVLARLPAESRDLLIGCSVAEVVSGPLADAITAGSGGHRTLAGLAASNSFVTAVTPDGRWFRCHPLLREVLHSLLNADPAAAATAHRRAAVWFAANGLTARGVHHAANSTDWILAAQLLINGGWEAVMVRGLGEPTELVPILQADLAGVASGEVPKVLTARALVAAATGRWAVARTTLDQLAGLPTDATATRLVRCVHLMVCHLDGRLDLVEEHVAALTVTQGDLIATWATLVRGESHYWSRRYPEAEADLEQVVAAATNLGLPALAVRALGMLTMTATATGRLDPAAEYARRGATIARARLAPGPGIVSAPGGADQVVGAPIAALDLGNAYLAAMRGDEPTVERLLDRVDAALCESEALEPAMVAGACLTRANLLLRQRRHAKAWALLQASPVTASPGAYHLTVVRRWLLAEIMIGLGRPADVDVPIDRDPDLRGRLSQARLSHIRGIHGVAEDLVRSVVTSMTPAPDPETLIFALLLRAEIEYGTGQEHSAVESANRAMDLAEPPGLFWPFGMVSAELRPLLARHPQLADRWPADLGDLGDLGADGDGLGRIPAQRRVVADDLTERELTVLRWMTTPMSVAEIADELCVSVNTVKTHISSVYRKLGTGRRRDAIVAARERRLL